MNRARFLACLLSLSSTISLSMEELAQPLSSESFARIRCSTDGKTTYVTGEGEIFLQKLGKSERVFGFKGVNIASCFQANGMWWLSSREVFLYLDPDTSEIINEWTHPTTGEVLPVVHVANRLVQFPLFPAEADVSEDILSIRTSFVTQKANPLDSAEFGIFRQTEDYSSIEAFTLVSSVQQLATENPSIAHQGSWSRSGPAAPWMKLDKDTRLFYSTNMKKVDDLGQSSPELFKYLKKNLPEYLNPPRCLLANPNVSSWTYFADNFDAYRAGKTFPYPEDFSGEVCREN